MIKYGKCHNCAKLVVAEEGEDFIDPSEIVGAKADETLCYDCYKAHYDWDECFNPPRLVFIK